MKRTSNVLTGLRLPFFLDLGSVSMFISDTFQGLAWQNRASIVHSFLRSFHLTYLKYNQIIIVINTSCRCGEDLVCIRSLYLAWTANFPSNLHRSFYESLFMLTNPVGRGKDNHQTQIILISVASFPYFKPFGKPRAGHSHGLTWSLCVNRILYQESHS